MKETIQQECAACEQVITLSTPNPLIEYCLTCTEELNAYHDSQPDMSELEADAWAAQYDNDPNPYLGTY